MKIADTALPVAALTDEAETERMQHWLGRQPEDNLAISDWVAAEFSSALYSEDRPGRSISCTSTVHIFIRM